MAGELTRTPILLQRPSRDVRYACVRRARNGTLRLIYGNEVLADALQTAILDTWTKGLKSRVSGGGAWEWVLKGAPWKSCGKIEETVQVCKLYLAIIGAFRTYDWELVTSARVGSGISATRELFFRSASLVPLSGLVSVCLFDSCDRDRIWVIGEGVSAASEAVLAAVRRLSFPGFHGSTWHNGCFEIAFHGSPWRSSSQGPELVRVIVTALSDAGYRPLSSIDIKRGKKRVGHAETEVGTLIFGAEKSQRQLQAPSPFDVCLVSFEADKMHLNGTASAMEGVANTLEECYGVACGIQRGNVTTWRFGPMSARQSAKLFKGVIQKMLQKEWNLIMAPRVSRGLGAPSSLVFQHVGENLEPCTDLLCIQLRYNFRLDVHGPCSEEVKLCIKQALNEVWQFGFDSRVSNDIIVYEIEHSPWSAKKRTGYSMRALLMHIFDRLEKIGWKLLMGLDVTLAGLTLPFDQEECFKDPDTFFFVKESGGGDANLLHRWQDRFQEIPGLDPEIRKLCV